MTQNAKIQASVLNTNAYFGRSVSISGDVIIVGAYGDYNNSNNSGSAYVFKKPISGWANMSETAKLLHPDGVETQYFGCSVSISGDNIVVGAGGYGFGPSTSGSAYIYTKPVSGWTNMTQTAKITSSDGVNEDFFGGQVCISGDNIVIGASWDNDNGTQSGSAYMFTKPTSGWTNITQTAKIKPSDGASGKMFGTSVCISGDNVFVGTPYAPSPSILTYGSVYHFAKPLSGWADMTETQEINCPVAYTNKADEYGYTVSIDSNYAVVGAPGYKNHMGMAYVLFNNGNDWITQAKLTASDGSANDYFGASLCISGDNIVIGAYDDDDNGINSGSAYVFSKPIAGWANMTQTAKIKADDGSDYNYFGSSIGISGDNIVVGAYNDDDNGAQSGSAYVFTKPVTGWKDTTQTAKIIPSDGAAADNFGSSVSISGDIIVVGANQNKNNNIRTGSAYIFERPIAGWANMTQTAKIKADDGSENDFFGNSVGISGDNIIVGSYFDDDNGYLSGSAYVFTKPIAGWVDTTQTAKIKGSDLVSGDYFGCNVSISKDKIVVGAYGDDDNGPSSGSAYVFTKPVTGWTNMTQTTKIKPSDGIPEDEFGYSVGISGDNIIVGAHFDDDNMDKTGSAYFFKEFCADVNVTVNANEITAHATGATYQWLDCNNNFAIIPGEINQSFNVTLNGSYAVEVTQNGCTDTSACQNIILGIGDYINIPHVVIYPNPASTKLYIDGLATFASVEVYDISGKLLISIQLNTNQIDISPLAKGLYFIKLSTEEGSVVRKFEKE
jgi:hypothetical protein